MIPLAEGVLLNQDMTITARVTGRTTSLPGVEIWRFANDQVSDIDVYYKDTTAMVDILDPIQPGTPT